VTPDQFAGRMHGYQNRALFVLPVQVDATVRARAARLAPANTSVTVAQTMTGAQLQVTGPNAHHTARRIAMGLADDLVNVIARVMHP